MLIINYFSQTSSDQLNLELRNSLAVIKKKLNLTLKI